MFDIARVMAVVTGVALSLIRKQELYAFLSVSMALILFSIQDVTQGHYGLAASTLLLSTVPVAISVLRSRGEPKR